MPAGPGKYDDICTEIREKAKATGVIAIVLGGDKGNGFSAQLPPHLAHSIPRMLRDMADQIEASRPEMAEPVGLPPHAQEVLDWLASDDTGVSSESLAFEYLGKKASRIDAPYDPADLGRCLRLITLVPEIRRCVDSLGLKHKRWAVAAKHWHAWTAMMVEEVGIDWSKGKEASKTYELMKKSFEESK